MKTLHFIIFFILFILPKTIVNAEIIDKNIEIGFSPLGNSQKIILDAIKNTKYSIDIAAYSFTSKPITLALLEAQKKGIKIRVLADKKSNTNKYTAITYLVNHNISVKLNGKYAIMHNKFMIFDKKSVQTGSFNYTKNAINRNAENVIFLKNNVYISDKYIKEFDRLWLESSEYKNKY